MEGSYSPRRCIRRKRAPFRHLDVAGGTAISVRIAKAGGPQTQVTLLDIDPDMLRSAARAPGRRASRKGSSLRRGQCGIAAISRQRFDAYTIAFGIRNVPRIQVALNEAFRVLRRGGHFLCLEFSQVDSAALDRVYEAYSFRAIPAIG